MHTVFGRKTVLTCTEETQNQFGFHSGFHLTLQDTYGFLQSPVNLGKGHYHFPATIK